MKILGDSAREALNLYLEPLRHKKTAIPILLITVLGGGTAGYLTLPASQENAPQQEEKIEQSEEARAKLELMHSEQDELD